MPKRKKIEKKITMYRGFTLIETMIAVFILTVSIGAPLQIVTKGLTASFFARDQITAFYLAQEAVEYIRNRRDENTLAGNTWLFGLDDCLLSNVCDVDISTNQIILCPSGTCPPLLYDYDKSSGSGSGFYKHSTGVGTAFTRSVELRNITPEEVSVSVKISWNTGPLLRDFRVNEHIFNWQQPASGGGGGGGGACLPATEAENLVVNTSGAFVGPPGNRRLRNITVENTCGTGAITINQIRILWTNGEDIEQIQIEGISVFAGSQSSGPTIDIVPNHTITSGGTDTIDFFRFSDDMAGNTFTITFFMSDLSSSVPVTFSP